MAISHPGPFEMGGQLRRDRPMRRSRLAASQNRTVPRLRLLVLLLCCLSLAAGQSASVVGSLIKRSYVDDGGQVHVVYGDGRDLRIAAEKKQVSSDVPAVAPDKETVGWLVNVPNCCTSYPIPTTLVIYRSGRIIRRISDGMMLYKWQFLDRGRQVAVSSGTVHGMNGIHLTLYESRTGRQLKTWNGEDGDVPPKWGVLVAH
jgi:hypothetical protein